MLKDGQKNRKFFLVFSSCQVARSAYALLARPLNSVGPLLAAQCTTDRAAAAALAVPGLLGVVQARRRQQLFAASMRFSSLRAACFRNLPDVGEAA